jgi:hypothetical protein
VSLLRLDEVPAALLDILATDLHQLFPGPTLLQIDGANPAPLFVSVLLHGNETSGLVVVQNLLRRYAGRDWPRAAAFFFGNVQAAREGLRRQDDQPDFNRIWPGGELADCAQTRLARGVYEEMAGRGVFASIDVHNNTGLNPCYSCVERLDADTLGLAALFDPLAVYSLYPKGTQTGAFAEVCPSLTLECGQPNDAAGIKKAVDFIDASLSLSAIPPAPSLDLFHSLAQVTVREGVRFSFADASADLVLSGDLDSLNFTEIKPGTVIGQIAKLQPGALFPLIARTDDGRDVAAEFFALEQGRLVLRKPVMPSMLTLDERVIRQDCLGYLMERIGPSP